jgi:hypothetical protein
LSAHGPRRRPALCLRQVLGCACVALLSSCLLTADLDHLGNSQCPPDRKLCNGKCISKTNPQTGCAADTCVPCTLPHATANCANKGECGVAACLETYKDCNGDPRDGCEVDPDHDPTRCGSCSAQACVTPNAVPDCAAGVCALRSCKQGFGDCNKSARDGCETDLSSDSSNCSKCGDACPQGMTCQSGQCR